MTHFSFVGTVFARISHTSPTNAATLASKGFGGYTHHPRTAHTAAHTAKHGTFWMGALSLPSVRFARFGNLARPGVRTAYFAAFRSWSRVLPKDAESLRNSDALMRVAVPRRRGPAGLREPIAASLHRGTPRFWSTVITECREKHTSFLCTELLCQLCLRLPPLCCAL